MKQFLPVILLLFTLRAGAQDVKPFYDSINEKYGFTVSKTIEPQFDNVWECLTGAYIFEVNDQYGYINANGEIDIPPMFDFAAEHSGSGYLFLFHSDTMYVWNSNNLTILDTFVLADGMYSLLFDANQFYIQGYDHFRVKKDGKMAYASVFNGIEINLKTDFLLNINYECSKKSKSVLLAGNNGKLSFYDNAGKQLFPHVIDDYLGTEKENAIVMMNGKVQFINLCTGKISNTASGFNEMICTNLNNKKGVINSKGNIIFPFEYDEIKSHRNNYYKLLKWKTDSENKYEYQFLGIFDNAKHNYVRAEDLNLNWSEQNCDGLDFLKDIHGVKNPNAEVPEYAMAVFLYNPETKMLEKKSDFMYWMMDCYADKEGKITIWSGPDKIGKIDRKANVEWREK